MQHKYLPKTTNTNAPKIIKHQEMAPGFSHGFSARPGPKEMQVLDGLDHFSLFKPLAKAMTGVSHQH